MQRVGPALVWHSHNPSPMQRAALAPLLSGGWLGFTDDSEEWQPNVAKRKGRWHAYSRDGARVREVAIVIVRSLIDNRWAQMEKGSRRVRVTVQGRKALQAEP